MYGGGYTMLKVCKECGKEFETNRKYANLCNGEHIRTCIVCGKDFPVSHQQIRDNKRTCSRECTQAFQVLRMKECLSAKTKVCPECGREFTPRNNNQVYCENDHYRPCPVCGKPVKVKHAADLASDVQRTCSDECLKIYLSNKMKEIKPKKEVVYRKCIICGKEFPLMWPYTAVTCSPRCKGMYCKKSGIAKERTRKASQTCLERYGSDNPAKVPEFREAMTETLLANYGVTHALKSSVILDKVKDTNRKKFGTDWAFQNEDVKRRYKETMVEKYGVDNYWKSGERIISTMSDPSKADNYLSFKEDPLRFILSHYSEKPTVAEICKARCNPCTQYTGDLPRVLSDCQNAKYSDCLYHA